MQWPLPWKQIWILELEQEEFGGLWSSPPTEEHSPVSASSSHILPSSLTCLDLTVCPEFTKSDFMEISTFVSHFSYFHRHILCFSDAPTYSVCFRNTFPSHSRRNSSVLFGGISKAKTYVDAHRCKHVWRGKHGSFCLPVVFRRNWFVPQMSLNIFEFSKITSWKVASV